MDQKNFGIIILAGNSCVYRNNNGEIVAHAQLHAFGAALKFARQCIDNGRPQPRICVELNHGGIYRLQFLDEDLSYTQKRRPHLNHLHPSIQRIFQPVAEKYQIPLSDIHVIHEDSKRQYIACRHPRKAHSQLTDSYTYYESSVKNKTSTCTTNKVYFERAAHPYMRLEAFFQGSDWSGSLNYVRKLQLCYSLGAPTAIRLNLVNEVGEVNCSGQVKLTTFI